VGPQRKKALLEAFGSVQGVRDAAEADVAAIPGVGEGLARRIQLALGRKAAGEVAPQEPELPELEEGDPLVTTADG
jgi:excinuclease ABC subunit C